MKAIKNKIIYLIVVGIIGISLFITGIVRDGNTIVGFGAALTAVSASFPALCHSARYESR